MDYPKKGGFGSGIHSFMIIPGCPNPLLEETSSPKWSPIPFWARGSGHCWIRMTHPCPDLGPGRRMQIVPSASPISEPSAQGFLAEVSKVWAEKKIPMGLARHQAPFLVQLKAGAKPVQIRQNPVPREARTGQPIQQLARGSRDSDCLPISTEHSSPSSQDTSFL